MSSGYIERINKVIDHYCISPSELAKRSGIDVSNFNKMLKGQQKITKQTLKKIADANNISFNWLYADEGNMLNSEQSPSLLPITDKVIADNDGNNQSPPHVIKYYPNVNGSMGGVQFLDDPDETVCDITIPGYSDCKFAINAYGDSMYPLIKSGQIILMSEWLESFIDWGRIYLVVTKSGYRVIKRLYPGTSNATVTCKSENSETNPPFEIERDDILKVYLVKGWICREVI